MDNCILVSGLKERWMDTANCIGMKKISDMRESLGMGNLMGEVLSIMLGKGLLVKFSKVTNLIPSLLGFRETIGRDIKVVSLMIRERDKE